MKPEGLDRVSIAADFLVAFILTKPIISPFLHFTYILGDSGDMTFWGTAMHTCHP